MYAKQIGITLAIIAISSSIYAMSLKSPEERMRDAIILQNQAIEELNSAKLESYLEIKRQCEDTASGTSREILEQLTECSKMEKPNLQELIQLSGDSGSGVNAQTTDSKDLSNRGTGTGKIVGPLRTDLGLTDCRFTNAKHELRGYSWVAYDIACEPGESFWVKAPKSKEEWIVSAIGYDANCGDYTVLRHADIYFQYCHTKTHMTVGTNVQPGEVIGKTNMSGETSAMHLHVAILKEYPHGLFFLSTDEYYNGQGEIISAKELFDMYPTLQYDTLKSIPTASSGGA